MPILHFSPILRSRARALMLGLFVAGVLLHLFFRPGFEGDTQALIRDAEGALGCLRSGAPAPCTAAGQFPPFQFLPAVGLLASGFSPAFIVHLFAYASLVAFLWLLWSGARSLSKIHPGLACAWVGLIVSGYGIWYSRSSFSEMTASLAILGMVTALAQTKLRQAFIWAALAAVTKDTAGIPLLALCLLAHPGDARLALRKSTWPGLGIAAGILICGSLNFFRFGVPWNRKYLSPEFLVHGGGTQLSFFWGAWISPAAGLLWFWPALAALLIWSGTQRPRKTALGVMGLLGFLCLGFARWYAPYGWIAWGNRLLFPWLPACGYLLLRELGPKLMGLVQSARGWVYWTWVTSLAVASFPQFQGLVRSSAVVQMLETPSCSGEASIQKDATEYYRCLSTVIWPKSPRLLNLYRPFPRPDLFILGLLNLGFLLELGRRCRFRALVKIRNA